MNFQQFIQVNSTTFNQNIDRKTTFMKKQLEKFAFPKFPTHKKKYLGQIFPKKRDEKNFL